MCAVIVCVSCLIIGLIANFPLDLRVAFGLAIVVNVVACLVLNVMGFSEGWDRGAECHAGVGSKLKNQNDILLNLSETRLKAIRQLEHNLREKSGEVVELRGRINMAIESLAEIATCE